ncbi:MAG: hypothetical protein ACP5NY_04225 [Thermocladium sp.]
MNMNFIDELSLRRVAAGLLSIDVEEFAFFRRLMVTPADEAWGIGAATQSGVPPTASTTELVSDAVYLYNNGEAVRPLYIPILRLWGGEGEVRRLAAALGAGILHSIKAWGLVLPLLNPGPPGDWPMAVARELGLAWFPYSPFPGTSLAEVVKRPTQPFIPPPTAMGSGYRPLPPLPREEWGRYVGHITID